MGIYCRTYGHKNAGPLSLTATRPAKDPFGLCGAPDRSKNGAVAIDANKFIRDVTKSDSGVCLPNFDGKGHTRTRRTDLAWMPFVLRARAMRIPCKGKCKVGKDKCIPGCIDGNQVPHLDVGGVTKFLSRSTVNWITRIMSRVQEFSCDAIPPRGCSWPRMNWNAAAMRDKKKFFIPPPKENNYGQCEWWKKHPKGTSDDPADMCITRADGLLPPVAPCVTPETIGSRKFQCVDGKLTSQSKNELGESAARSFFGRIKRMVKKGKKKAATVAKSGVAKMVKVAKSGVAKMVKKVLEIALKQLPLNMVKDIKYGGFWDFVKKLVVLCAKGKVNKFHCEMPTSW